MSKHKTEIIRQDGVPFIWGWDDESIYFELDGISILPVDKAKRIQDYPSLHTQILKLCKDFFENKGNV